MKRVLITGMSGVGKSSVIAALAARGHKAVDLDYAPYADGDRWRLDEVSRLLDAEDAPILFVSGASEDQSRFYPRFDHVVLLTAPDVVMSERMVRRTNNPYGKDPADVTRNLALRPRIEPLLRRAADLEVDTRAPLDDVVERILRHVAGRTA